MAADFQVITIDEDFADEVRRERADPEYRHPAHAELADDPAPCRVCLRSFVPGTERRLLLTYNPFRDSEPLPLPGPVFIHEDSCEPYRDAAFPTALRDSWLTFDGYGKNRTLVSEVRTQAPDEIESVLEELAGEPSVDYVHVRSTRAGCFLCTLRRGP
ncbi:MAG: DUF1203 domain-containing protein [Actinobacteria bacterium]|nr:DUF1203 domain-containing protein [Actinomycetota bacterium]